MGLGRDSTVVFIGDSITDSGRRDAAPPLGNGYVALFKDLVDVRRPELRLNVVNKGVSGNTVRDLKERWEDDVLALGPQAVSVLIGINDLHRYLGGDQGLSPDGFYETYREILEATTRRLDAVLLLMAPFYVARPQSMDTFRKKVLEVIPHYVEAVERLSAEYSTLYVDLHAEFQRLLEHVPAEELAPDAVHPTRKGHMLIALKAYDSLF
ncbi:MAG: SGNH/GDSL hydrolase family protein [Thermoproteus sp.]|jgi:lysophospholipase L1-like esterase